MKKVFLLSMVVLFAITSMAQKIKGPESVSYFQAPSIGVKFAKANVYMSHDQALATAKKEAQQDRNSAFGANFGSAGTAVADAANSAMDYMESFNKMLDAYKDDEGRFAVWNFVPDYIIADAETDRSVNVEIFILNEPDPSPGATMPTTPDKEGYYDVPYYVNCRYKVLDHTGEVLFEENLGILQGTQKSKDYTPVESIDLKDAGKAAVSQANEAGEALMAGDLEDDVPVQDRIGTNKAYNAVRTAVFARYGFGQFSAPIKLGVVKESKASKKMIKPMLEIFEGKEGLLLSKDDKAEVRKFAEEMESVLPHTTEKTKWVALHNLSVSYAWLEDAEKAADYYQQYGEEIKTTLLKMECWNKVLAKEMTGKEMKATCGSTFIGMKDQKKFAQYNNIKNFVNFYPKGVNRYNALLIAINRDLKQFVDFYAVNDLLCQLYEIDFPYQFFPLQDFKGEPKDMRAVVTKEGMEPIEYRVKFNSKRRIKQLEADQKSILSDGSKEKLYTREIMPQYDDNGKYKRLETDAGWWSDEMTSTYYYSRLNYVYDPIAYMTKGKAENITKKAGFFGAKESEESVQLKVDLEGNIYFTGKSKYFKANAFYKELLDEAGIIPKRVDTKTTFNTKTNINEDGVMTEWHWEGDVFTDFSSPVSTRVQQLAGTPMIRSIKFVEVDEHGNPLKIDFELSLTGTMSLEEKAKGMAFVNKYLVRLNGPKPTVTQDGFQFDATGTWDCKFEYDEAGNWTSMKIGPYTAERTFKY